MKNKLLVLTKNQDQYAEGLKKLNLPDLEIFIPTNDSEISDKISEANIFLVNPVKLKPYLNQAKNLAWVQSTWAGVDTLMDDDLRKDYLLTNLRGFYGQPISEYVFAYILAFGRDVFRYREQQKNKQWQEYDFKMLSGKKIGIMGTGSIGGEIAKVAKVFGMQTLGFRTVNEPVENFDRIYTDENFKDFLSQADYVVSVLPSTRNTNHIINEKTLGWMKSSAVFINVGRGNAVDEQALATVLKQNKIAAVVLDVFAQEPLPKNSPFWDLSNAYITPHISGYIVSDKIFEVFEENYKRFTSGQELINEIDFKKGY